jgi:hypothetical protein
MALVEADWRPVWVFLVPGPIGRESPCLWALEKLGFPWILSSESSLFNGLRGIFAGRNFSRPFARRGPQRRNRRQPSWHAEALKWSWDESNSFYDFQREIVVERCPPETRFGLVYQIYRLLRRAALFVVTGAHVAGADKQAEGTAV